MIVTLRRAGRFDPVQFFRVDLIQIKSISANLAQGDQCWADDGQKPSIMPAIIGSAGAETSCFDACGFFALATIVAKMSRHREF
jgi:hypothetical protein